MKTPGLRCLLSSGTHHGKSPFLPSPYLPWGLRARASCLRPANGAIGLAFIYRSVSPPLSAPHKERRQWKNFKEKGLETGDPPEPREKQIEASTAAPLHRHPYGGDDAGPPGAGGRSCLSWCPRDWNEVLLDRTEPERPLRATSQDAKGPRGPEGLPWGGAWWLCGNKVEFSSSPASFPRSNSPLAQFPSCLGQLGARLQPLSIDGRKRRLKLVSLWPWCRRPHLEEETLPGEAAQERHLQSAEQQVWEADLLPDAGRTWPMWFTGLAMLAAPFDLQCLWAGKALCNLSPHRRWWTQPTWTCLLLQPGASCYREGSKWFLDHPFHSCMACLLSLPSKIWETSSWKL